MGASLYYTFASYKTLATWITSTIGTYWMSVLFCYWERRLADSPAVHGTSHSMESDSSASQKKKKHFDRRKRNILIGEKETFWQEKKGTLVAWLMRRHLTCKVLVVVSVAMTCPMSHMSPLGISSTLGSTPVPVNFSSRDDEWLP